MQRRSVSLLLPDDRQRLTDEIGAVIDEPTDKRLVARGLVCGWSASAAEGDDQAARILTAVAEDGTLRAISEQNRASTGIFLEPASGQVLNVPRRASVPTTDGNGTSTGRQLKLWRDLTWPEFDEWAAGQLQLAVSMRLKARGVRIIQELHKRFPLSHTPGEACSMAGIDPDSLELSA